MHNLWTLYKYEIQKLTDKMLFRIAAFLCMVCILISFFAPLIGTYYVDGEPVEGGYEAFKKDRAYRKALSGRAIDTVLLTEAVDAYRHVPSNARRYTLTDEYEQFARPYSDIFNMIRSWTGMDLSSIQSWEADGDTLYEARIQRLESNWQSIPLSEAEKDFWRKMEGKIVMPLIYEYHEGYDSILNDFLTVGVLMLMFVSVCLSNLFADEHIRRTDQLVLSSRKGKAPAYWAKILAGVSVSVAAAVIMALTTMGISFCIYGADGFDMPFQVCYSTYSYPISIGQAVLIAYGVLVAASVLTAVFVMVISEVFRSGIVALSVSTVLIIMGNVIMIPTQYRVIAQIWDWSPMAYLSTWNVFDPRTLTLFGRCFVSWQVVPPIYILLSIALAVCGNIVYRRYQVSGR